MERLHLDTKELPDSPGVYFFLGPKNEILYIGKATSLKSRVRSYFAKNLQEARSELISNMVREAVKVDVTTTESVLEALILETNLIRSHKPKFNTRSKDDKSYNHVIITNEEWPRVLVVRGKDITEHFEPKEISYHFGPFPSGGLLREALKIIRKIFRFYDTKKSIGSETSKISKGTIDFNRQIGLYPDSGDKVEYAKTIRHLRLFFQGKKAVIITELERDMSRYAKNLEFEKAGIAKKKIFALQHIEDVALIKSDRASAQTAQGFRIEAYDIAHMAGQSMVGVMTVLHGGEPQKAEYRKFKIKTVTGANDPAALKEVITRRLTHLEWPFPNLVVVDGNEVQKKVAELLLSQAGLLIPVVGVVKDDRHKAAKIIGDKKIITQYTLEILHANAESHRFAIAFYRSDSRKKQLL